MTCTIKLIEKENFSNWFKRLFYIAFIFYIVTWFFTICLSDIQKKRNFDFILPVANSDSGEYRNLTESMLSGNGFSEFGHIDTLQTPGYPAFVAIFKYSVGSYFMVTLVQIFLVFLSAIILRRLGNIFYPRVGEIAASLFILNPVVWVLSLIIMTDILFLFLFLLAFYLASSASRGKLGVVFSSIIFALAIYVRPMGIFALPIFAVPFLISDSAWKEKIKAILIMVFIVLLAVAPWVYRNYRLTGVADFSSFKAANLSLYAAPMFLANINHTDVETEKKNLEKVIGVPSSKWRDLQYSGEVSGAAMKVILVRPFAYAKYHLTTSFSFLFASTIQNVLETYNETMHIPNSLESGAMTYLVSHQYKLFLESITAIWWKVAERVIWVFIYVVAIFGIWQERRKIATWAFVFVPVYLMLLAGPLGNARYAVQSLPFKLVLFGVGAVWLINKLMKKNEQK